MEAEWVKHKVRACPRCGHDHTMIFRPFHTPATIAGTPFNWWGLCPALGTPVLLEHAPGEGTPPETRK